MKLHEAIAVTYAAVGQELSDAAMAIMSNDLAGYPPNGVMQALSRCRKELRKITLADILERIPGGHPGPEEAWAIVSPALNDERCTIIMTNEMSEAFGVALGLSDDSIAARMAFKETYSRLVAESRDKGTAINWFASLGHDKSGREGPLLDAMAKGRFTAPHVKKLLPYHEVTPEALALLEKAQALEVATVPA